MKPTYTVRLTDDLDPAERARIAGRVAGTTDIDASKFERLLERGKGKDLIRPSTAGVANRLASVLAEAGAPVQLVPVSTEPTPVQVEEESARTEDEPTRVQETTTPPAAGAEAAMPQPEPVVDEDTQPALGLEDAVPPAAAPPAVETVETPPEPEVQTPRAPREPKRSLLDEPPPPAPEPRGSGLLGSVGAALLGLGALFGMSFLVDPLAIGILVLAVLALGLALLGQRRATWLPGLGALALVVWAFANADAGVAASLADQWQWYAMFAGALLVIIAGWREARRDRGL